MTSSMRQRAHISKRRLAMGAGACLLVGLMIVPVYPIACERAHLLFNSRMFGSHDYDDIDGRGTFREALERMGPVALPTLRRYLSDPRPDVRAEALVAIGAIGVRDEEQLIRRFTGSPSRLVRLGAYLALLRLDCSDVEGGVLAEVDGKTDDGRIDHYRALVVRELIHRNVADVVDMLLEGVGSSEEWWSDHCATVLLVLCNDPSLDKNSDAARLREGEGLRKIRAWWLVEKTKPHWRSLSIESSEEPSGPSGPARTGGRNGAGRGDEAVSGRVGGWRGGGR